MAFIDRVRVQLVNAPTMVLALAPSRSAPCGLHFHIRVGERLSVADWIPPKDPDPSDNFYSINRAVDPMRLAGIRVRRPKTLPYKESILHALRDAVINGGRPDEVLVPESWGLGGQEMVGYYGMLKLIEEPGLPDDTAFLVQADTWSRLQHYPSSAPTLACEAPGYNVRLTLYDEPVKPVVKERPCPNCGCPNDLGVKSCWWCEYPNPTKL